MRFGFRVVGSACRQVFSHLTLSFGGNVLGVLSLKDVPSAYRLGRRTSWPSGSPGW